MLDFAAEKGKDVMCSILLDKKPELINDVNEVLNRLIYNSFFRYVLYIHSIW